MADIEFTKDELKYLFEILDGVNARGLSNRRRVVTLMDKLKVLNDSLSGPDDAVIVPDRQAGRIDA